MAQEEERQELIRELREGPNSRRDYVDDFVNASVALQIKVLRLHREWTQEELADKAHLGQSQISDYENINHPPPKIDILKRIAAAFDLPLIVRLGSWGDFVEGASGMNQVSLQYPRFERDPAMQEAGPKLARVIPHPAAQRQALADTGSPPPESMAPAGKRTPTPTVIATSG